MFHQHYSNKACIIKCWRALGNTIAPYQGKHHGGRPSYDGRKSGRNGGRKATATTRKEYVAPTANHHDVLFTSGTTKDAAEFKDTVQILARHESTASG